MQEQAIQSRVGGAQVARNALLNLAGFGAPLLAALATLPALIDGLGQERFGILAVAWMLVAYFSELGFGATMTRYAAAALGAGRPDELSGIAWTTAGLQAVVGAALGITLALLTPWLAGSVLRVPDALVAEARTCLFLLSAAIPMLGVGRSFRSLVEAAQRFDLALMIQVPITTGTYVLAAIAASRGWSLPAVFGIILGARMATVPCYFFAVRRALPGVSLRPALHRHRLRELSVFAGWAAVSSVVSPLLIYLDRFLVAVLLSMTAVTFYAAPYEVVARLILVPTAIVAALYPAFSQLSGATRPAVQAEQLAARSVAMVVVLLGPILILILGGAQDGLTLWLGADYARRSGVALQILAIGVLANAAAHVPFTLLQSVGRPDLPARFHLLELPLHLGAAWFLVSRFGITGAAMAWTGRMVVDAALLFGAAARTQVLSGRALFGQSLRRALEIVAIAGIAAALVAASVDAPAARIAAAGTLAAGSAMLLWRVAVTEGERQRVVTLLRLRV